MNLRSAPYDNNAPSFGSEDDRFYLIVKAVPAPDIHVMLSGLLLLGPFV